MKYQELKEQLNDGSFDKVIKKLYGSSEQIMSHQRKRYLEAVMMLDPRPLLQKWSGTQCLNPHL